MKHLILILKGFVFGIANIIPGLSGGTMAVIMKIYEKMLDSINNIFKKFKQSFLFLLPLAIGVLLALVFGSKGIDFCLTKFPIPTSLLFVGLVLGGIPLLYKEIHKKYNVKNIIIFIIAILLVVGLMFIPKSSKEFISGFDYVIIFICGMIAAAAMVIPGISGSMVLMLLGYYDVIIKALKNITDFSLLKNNLLILIPFALGAIIGFILCCKLISFLLKKFPTQSYFAIVGFVLASAIAIVINTISYNFNLVHLIIGIILIPVGFIITYYLSKKDKKD